MKFKYDCKDKIKISNMLRIFVSKRFKKKERINGSVINTFWCFQNVN